MSRKNPRARALALAPGLVACLALGLLAACGGSSSPSSATQAPPVDSVAARAGQAQMPPASGDPESLFQQASTAWQNGDYREAHRLFGTLYIAVPNHRGGVAGQALVDTCSRLEQDCRLVMIRLDIMRDAFGGRLGGPMNTWVSDQRRAFDEIIGCFDHAILGEYAQAMGIGARWVAAPVPEFAQAARVCLESAQSASRAAERRVQADRAIEPFQRNYACMNEYRVELLERYEAGDWEGFVENHTQYEACAAVVRDIVDSGVLDGDPRVQTEHDRAWTQISQIDVILEDHAETFEATRQGMLVLTGDAEYNYLTQELSRLQRERSGIEQQIQSLQAARAGLSGSERDQIDGTLRALQGQHESMRRRIHEVQVRLDEIRRGFGLPSRHAR